MALLPARFLDRSELEEDHLKLSVGQTWCVYMPELNNEAYFLVTRYSEDNRGWMALAISLGVGWLPKKDGDEMLFHVEDEIKAEHVKLVCDAPELASRA